MELGYVKQYTDTLVAKVTINDIKMIEKYWRYIKSTRKLWKFYYLLKENFGIFEHKLKESSELVDIKDKISKRSSRKVIVLEVKPLVLANLQACLTQRGPNKTL